MVEQKLGQKKDVVKKETVDVETEATPHDVQPDMERLQPTVEKKPFWKKWWVWVIVVVVVIGAAQIISRLA